MRGTLEREGDVRLLTITVVVAAASAMAQDPTRAREAYQAGSALVAQRRYAEAIAQFTLANQLAPHPVNLFNIAQCHRALADVPRALATFRDFLRVDPGSAQRPEAEQAVQALQAELAARGVQQVTVLVEPPEARAEVTIDGHPVGRAPATVELTAGTHQLQLTAPGFAPFSGRLTVRLERASDLSVPLRRASAAGTAPWASGAPPPEPQGTAPSSGPTAGYAPWEAPSLRPGPSAAAPADQTSGEAPPGRPGPSGLTATDQTIGHGPGEARTARPPPSAPAPADQTAGYAPWATPPAGPGPSTAPPARPGSAPGGAPPSRPAPSATDQASGYAAWETPPARPVPSTAPPASQAPAGSTARSSTRPGGTSPDTTAPGAGADPAPPREGPPPAFFMPPPAVPSSPPLLTAGGDGDRPVAAGPRPSLAPAGTSGTAATIEARTGPRRPVVGAWIASGGAALGLGLGIAMAAAASGAQGSLRSLPIKSFSQNQRLFDDAVAFQTVSIVAFAVAGAAAVTALILFLVEGR